MRDWRWMPVVGCKSNNFQCQNHLLTKLTMTCVGFDLLAHISASKNLARIQPIFRNLQSFFCGIEFIVNLIFFLELQSTSWALWTNNVASMWPIYFFLKNYKPFALSLNTRFCWADSNYNVGLGTTMLSKNKQGLSFFYKYI